MRGLGPGAAAAVTVPGENLILWGNQVSVALDAVSTFPMTYRIAVGGYPGIGNTDTNSLFRDAAGTDGTFTRAGTDPTDDDPHDCWAFTYFR
jgi:hypothetical protein